MRAPGTDLLTRVVDGAIGLVSPRRAVLRQHFRRMEREPEYRETVLAAARARGYRAAHDSKTKTPWSSSGFNSKSADAESILDAPKLRDRARELNRDDPIGSGAAGTFVREIIGTELRARSRAKNEKVQAACNEVWDERAETLTPTDPGPLGQWQGTLTNMVVVDGGMLLKRAVTKPGEPVWFELVEGERLKTPMDAKPADPQGRIVDGIEKDRHGRHVAYWVLKKHPNDFVPNTVGQGAIPVVGLTAEYFNRVPFEAARHVKLGDRPGQSRGVSGFHAVLQDLRDLDLLMLAALKRTQIAACFAVFIESTLAVPDLLDVTAENYGYQLEQELIPGMMYKLYPGEKISTLKPDFPTPELAMFVNMIARRIGAALGISWQSLLHDWSESSYSGARTTLLGDRQTFLILRHLILNGCLNWMWKTVMEDAVLRGDERVQGVVPKELAAVQWLADGWAWVDPLKEAQATQLKLQMRIVTLRDVCEETGGKYWEDQLRQSLVEEKRELELRKELGLPEKDPNQAPAPVAGQDKGQGQDQQAKPTKKRALLARRPRRSLPRRVAA